MSKCQVKLVTGVTGSSKMTKAGKASNDIQKVYTGLVYQKVAKSLYMVRAEYKEAMTLDLTSISDEYKEETLKPYLLAAKENGHPALVPFVSEGAYWYFSLFCVEESFYCDFKRVIVLYNNDTGAYSCPCRRARGRSKHCVHVYVTMSYINSTLSPKPADRLKPNVPAETRKEKSAMTKYLTEKDILSNFSLRVSSKDLIPEEETCFACKGALEAERVAKHLPVLSRSGEDNILLDLWSKTCHKCQLTFPYRQTDQGVFVYQKTAVSLVLLEEFCVAITTGRMSAESYLEYINEAYTNSLGYNKVMPVFYCYLGYKVKHEMTKTGVLSCYQCGFYPTVVIGDSIPSVNFATAFKRVEKGPMKGDKSHLLQEMIAPDVARSINENVEFPIYEHLPGFGTLENTCSSVSTRIRHQKGDDNAKSHNMPADKLAHLLTDKVEKLDNMLRELGLPVKGNKDEKIESIIKSGNYDNFIKVFPKVYGKSGGLLRLFCRHGIVVYMKFLVRAESSVDYAEALINMKFPPTLFVCDFIRQVVSSTNKRAPGFSILSTVGGLILRIKT